MMASAHGTDMLKLKDDGPLSARHPVSRPPT